MTGGTCGVNPTTSGSDQTENRDPPFDEYRSGILSLCGHYRVDQTFSVVVVSERAYEPGVTLAQQKRPCSFTSLVAIGVGWEDPGHG